MTPDQHDPKIESLATRMTHMAIASHVTIQQAASAHINCLANFALETAEGDEKKAAGILRQAMEQMIARVYDPSIRRKLQIVAGRIAGFVAPPKDH